MDDRRQFPNQHLLFRSIGRDTVATMPRIRVPAVLVVVLMAMTAAPAFGQTLPDVQPSAPYGVRVQQREGRSFLGFGVATRNVGPGTLRIQARGDGSGVMPGAWQLLDDGTIVPNVGTLKFVDSITHRHWHYLDFVRYEPRGIDHPTVLRDQKQGFCLDDMVPFVPGTWCARDEPERTEMELGVVPEGTDVYQANIEGQEIAIDPGSAPAGRYLLSARIGPTGVLRETRTGNNVSSTVIELTWPAGDPGTQPRPITEIEDCIGRGCTGTLPARNKASARKLARRALRRTFGRAASRGARVMCKAKADAHVCKVRLRRGSLIFRGRVRIWYALGPSATRWYYTLKGKRTCGGGAGCKRQVSRTNRLGGTVARVASTGATAVRASASSFVCRPNL